MTEQMVTDLKDKEPQLKKVKEKSHLFCAAILKVPASYEKSIAGLHERKDQKAAKERNIHLPSRSFTLEIQG